MAIEIDALWYQAQASGAIIATIQRPNNTSSMIDRRRRRLEANAVVSKF